MVPSFGHIVSYLSLIIGTTHCMAPRRQIPHLSHLYATNEAICWLPTQIFDGDKVTLIERMNCLKRNERYMSLTYDARNDFLYYFSNTWKTISRLPLKLGGSEGILTWENGPVHGMALDWVTGNLYWTHYSLGMIRMCSQSKDCDDVTTLVEYLSAPFGIAIHPGRQKIYWTEHGHPPKTGGAINMAGLDGSGKKSAIKKTPLGSPNHLSIDFKTDRMYFTDSMLHKIMVVNLETGVIKTVIEKPHQTFMGISVFQDQLLWSGAYDYQGIYRFSLRTRGEVARVDLDVHNLDIVADLITFDVKNQPWFESPCQANVTECSDLCAVEGDTKVARCLCSSGSTLTEDGFSCATVTLSDDFLLVVADNSKQILQVNLKNGDTTDVGIKFDHDLGAFTYEPYENKVYWADNEAHVIYEAKIGGRFQKIVKRFSRGRFDSLVSELAADYLNRLLFYMDFWDRNIGVVSMDNNNYHKVLFDIGPGIVDNFGLIAFPTEGKIYWLSTTFYTSTIEMANMDGSNREDFYVIGKQYHMQSLALDAKDRNLYWAFHDKKDQGTISMINLDTRKFTRILDSLFGSIALVGDYLYIDVWEHGTFRRMPKLGGRQEQLWTIPSRDYDAGRMMGFNKTDVLKGPTMCHYSDCEQLCLPRFKNYTCACTDGVVANGNSCDTPTTPVATTKEEATLPWSSTRKLTTPPTSTIASTTITTTGRPTTPVTQHTTQKSTTSTKNTASTAKTTSCMETTTNTKPMTTVKSTTTSKPMTTIKPMTNSKTKAPTETTPNKVQGTTLREVTTTKGPSSRVDVDIPPTTSSVSSTYYDERDHVGARKSSSGSSGTLSTTTVAVTATVICCLVILVIVFIIVYFKRRRRSFNVHSLLTESISSSRVGYSSSDSDRVTMEGGIANPTHACLNNLSAEETP